MPEVYFRTTWDSKVRVLTTVFTLILLGIAAIILSSYFIGRAHGVPLSVWPIIIPIILLLIILGSAAAFAPRGYLLTADEIRIVRFAPDIRVKLAAIEKLEIVEGKDVFRKAVRLGASGGAFGIYGRYYSAFQPDFQAYVTNTGPLLVIWRKKDVPLVISPDEPEEFIRQVSLRSFTS